MNSTFSGVEISKRGLFAQTQSLNTVGHNIANISTEGYSKQRVELASTYALYAPGVRAETPGQVGQGVDIVRIARQRNELLDNNIVAQAHKEGFWQKRTEYMQRLSEIYNEVGDSSIRNMLDRYWSAWEEVSTFPEQVASRITLIERADTLASAIKDRYGQVAQLRQMLDDEVVETVNVVNRYATDIAELNNKIKQSEALGDDPNDMRDKRDLLVDKLSKLINVTVERRDPDEFMLYTNGKVLIQGDVARAFEAYRDADNVKTHTVVWADTRDLIDTSGGELSAAIRARDEDVRDELQKLNTLTVTLSDTTNALHREGVSLNNTSGQNFFVETPAVLSAQGNYDSDGDGAFDQTWLYSMTGSNALELSQSVGFAGVISLPAPQAPGQEAVAGQPAPVVQVAYEGTDTVQDIIDRINASGAEVSASLDDKNRLVIRATASLSPQTPDFVIRTLSDSGEFLAGYSGLLAAPGAVYDWQTANAGDGLASGLYGVAPFMDPAASISVNEAIVFDPREIAAAALSQDGVADKGDGSVASRIAELRTANIGLSRTQTFEEFFADTTASIASRAQEALVYKETQELVMKKMRDDRASVSGVNLDEELQNMIKFQTAYGAAARFLTYVNSTYETLLNMV